MWLSAAIRVPAVGHVLLLCLHVFDMPRTALPCAFRRFMRLSVLFPLEATVTQNKRREIRAVMRAAQLNSPVRGGRSIGNTGFLLGLLLCAFMAQSSRPAAAHDEEESASPEFNPAACYQLVRNAGRHIAWARWEQQFPVEKTRSAVLREATPEWAVDLEKRWISDAYEWRASDEQIWQWAAELGSVDDLPSADQLSVHESIAIWLRRIARQCKQQDTHTAAAVNWTPDEPRPMR